jgi:uncharacterized membrane protein YjjP (DUF1212 family)
VRVAAANDAQRARILVFPTAMIVASGPEDWATIDAIPSLGETLRLDQVSALYELVEAAEAGEIDPATGLLELRRIRTMSPRHGRVVSVLAYAVMTVGLCLILQPTPADVVIAFGLGLLVGMLLLLTRGHTALTILVPAACATLVSALSFEAVAHGVADDPGLRTLIAPLITFLPGGMLTTATVELASGEMVAGASRLVSGVVQLLLLSFGIVAGAEIAGLPSEAAVTDLHVNLLGWWAPWLGVLLFGVAAAFFFSAPRGSLPWMLLVLIIAWLGQVVGGEVLSPEISGFVGALAMTPVALAVARLPGAPPSQVTFLPAFWLLVPGALGLIGVATVVGDPSSADAGDLIKPMGAILSVALGVLCGVTLFRGADATRATLTRRAPRGNRW